MISPLDIGSLILYDNSVELTGELSIGFIIANSGGVISKVTLIIVSEIDAFEARSILV